MGMPTVPDISGPDYAPAEANDDADWPLVSIIVPARNEEAHLEAALSSLLDLDYPRLQIVAIDDRSTDRTGEIIDRLASASDGRLQALHVTELPEGWLGKTHAMWLGGHWASHRLSNPHLPTAGRYGAPSDTSSSDRYGNPSEWILFTDADVVFRRDALRRSIRCAERLGADHFVLFPTLEMRTAGEKLMLSFFQLLFVFGHRAWKVTDPKARDHMGAGAFNLIRRSVYEEIGSYRKLRLAVLDDLNLGELVKKTGHRQQCAFGERLICLRWVHGAHSLIDNLTKNLFAVTHYSIPRTVGACALMLFLNELPWIGLVVAPGFARIGFAAAVASIACMYVGMSWYSPISPLYVFTHPVSSALFGYAILRSMATALWNGGVTWRGTLYSLDALRNALRSNQEEFANA
jgi:glycosyltransferase involved in cell wall biosynthesis